MIALEQFYLFPYKIWNSMLDEAKGNEYCICIISCQVECTKRILIFYLIYIFWLLCLYSFLVGLFRAWETNDKACVRANRNALENIIRGLQ